MPIYDQGEIAQGGRIGRLEKEVEIMKNNPHGIPGPRGPAGPEGQPGPAGPAGPIGPIGPDGKVGPDGPQGPQGVGLPGPQGAQGAPATAVTTNPPVLSKIERLQLSLSWGVAEKGNAVLQIDNGMFYIWDGIQWHESKIGGVQGPQGNDGPIGPAGPRGPEGQVGPKGKTGIQGPEGKVGSVGPQGDRGLRGPQGPAGPSVKVEGIATEQEIYAKQGKPGEVWVIGGSVKNNGIGLMSNGMHGASQWNKIGRVGGYDDTDIKDDISNVELTVKHMKKTVTENTDAILQNTNNSSMILQYVQEVVSGKIRLSDTYVPQYNQNIATKKYVDDLVGTGGSGMVTSGSSTIIKGDKGDKGDTGPAGLDGAKGEQGDKGSRGPRGNPGLNGKDGELDKITVTMKLPGNNITKDDIKAATLKIKQFNYKDDFTFFIKTEGKTHKLYNIKYYSNGDRSPSGKKYEFWAHELTLVK